MLTIFAHLLIFLGLLTLLIILLFASKKLNSSISNDCDFKLSKTKFRREEEKQFAKFFIKLNNKTKFFIDFPVSFRFYSNSRFKSKIYIKYKTLKTGRESEEIINKIIEFEEKTVEHIYKITDIIVGEIEIDIELKTFYGDPIIEFEILQNDLCDLKKSFKKIIKFHK